jgi:hypothetical protein
MNIIARKLKKSGMLIILDAWDECMAQIYHFHLWEKKWRINCHIHRFCAYKEITFFPWHLTESWTDCSVDDAYDKDGLICSFLFIYLFIYLFTGYLMSMQVAEILRRRWWDNKDVERSGHDIMSGIITAAVYSHWEKHRTVPVRAADCRAGIWTSGPRDYEARGLRTWLRSWAAHI